MNKKITVIAILAIIAIAVVTIITTTTTQNSQQKTDTKEKTPSIQIGVVTALTGSAASLGQPIQQGIDLAYEENKIKDKKYTVHITYADSKCDPGTETVSAVQNLLEVKEAKIIMGTACSSVTLALAPVTEKKQAILFSPSASSPAVTQAGDYVFRNWPSDAYEGTILANVISKRFTNQSVGILYVNNDWGVELKKVITDRLTKLNTSVVDTESIELESKDYKTQLTKLKAKNPGILILLVYAGNTEPLLNQINELDMHQQLFLPGWVAEDSVVLETSRDQLEGVIYAVPDIPISQEFKNKMINRYGTVGQNELVAALAYDSFNIIVDAIDTCGENTDCIKGYLYQTKGYQGAAGTTTFDQNGDVIDKQFIIKTIKNGELVEYNQN